MPHVVLIVDDDRSIRQACRMLLELEGFRVAEASSWVSFTEAFYHGKDHPDLVLFDINLGPSLPGDTLVASLRKGREHLGSGKASKLVLFSSFPEEEVAARASRCGADGYIMKDTLMVRAGAPFIEKVKAFLGFGTAESPSKKDR